MDPIGALSQLALQRIARRKLRKEERRAKREERRKNKGIAHGIAAGQFDPSESFSWQEPSAGSLVNAAPSLVALLGQAGGYSRSVWVDSYILPGRHELTSWANWALSQPNAGGHSEISEALSVDYFARMGGEKFVAEMEVSYWCEYKMVDFLVCLPAVFAADDKSPQKPNQRVGVSVTRAMGFPRPDDFDWRDALILLDKKLYGLIVAGESVNEEHNFSHSLLHVWCQTPRIAAILRQVYQSFDVWDFGLDVGENLVLVLTVCPAPQIYRNTPWSA